VRDVAARSPGADVEADPNYWRDVVRFRWLALAAYVATTASGVLPQHMPWLAVALTMLTANTLAYTWHRRKNFEYSWYEDASSFSDVVSITLIIIASGSTSHPIWVAYVLILPAVANFKQLGFMLVFAGSTIVCYGCAYLVIGAAGEFDDWRGMTLRTVLLMLVSVNSIMISANNFRLRRVIEHQAMTDPLTGLANRRRLFDVLGERVEEARPLAVMMIDLDDFKMINESLGHITADRILAGIGEVFQDVAPPPSVAARYGGDEFALIAEVPDVEAAQALGERLIAAAQERAGVGLTIGIAMVPGDAATLERALYLADARLRAAKGAGKRRAVLKRAA
jgi:diguanylate cyclase (GGDEF)-like protein